MAKDTVVVVKTETYNTCRQIDTEVDCSENFEITYHSSFYGCVFYDRTLAYPPRSSNQVERTTPEFEILPNDDFPIYNNNNQFFPSLVVNGITYMSIFKLRLDYYQPGTPNYRAADFYWAKNVGLIKKVLYEGTGVKSWSLIEKEVYQ
jgi:hypothetical protein